MQYANVSLPVSFHLLQALCTEIKKCIQIHTADFTPASRLTGLSFLPWHNNPQWPRANLNNEDSWSHSDTSHSVGILWTSVQPEAETSDNTQHSKETDIHAPGGIRTRNSSKRVAADPRLIRRGLFSYGKYQTDFYKILQVWGAVEFVDVVYIRLINSNTLSALHVSSE